MRRQNIIVVLIENTRRVYAVPEYSRPFSKRLINFSRFFIAYWGPES
jgi:hypothetical protein